MDDKHKNIVAAYDDSEENTLRSMLGDFYNRKMLLFVIVFYVSAFIFIALAVISAIRFFKTDDTKSQIMYATIFSCCSLSTGFIKVLAWIMCQRNSFRRAIRKLELTIAELKSEIRSQKSEI